MAKKNQQTETVQQVEEKVQMTLEQAREIVNAPKGTHEALLVGRAQRRINAIAREALAPDVRAKADYMDLINDAADRINLGGKGTISGACGRFSAISRETGKSLVSTADLNRGLDFLLKQVEIARGEIGVKAADRTGFEL